jgi:general secretion pathway protein B
MSLILDALRKADRERQQQDTAPGIDAPHASNPEPSRPLWPWFLAVALVIIGLLIAIVWLLLSRPEPPAAPLASPQAQPAASQAAVSSAASSASAAAPARANSSAGYSSKHSSQQSDSSAASSSKPSNNAIAQLYRDPPAEPAQKVAPRPKVTPVTAAPVSPPTNSAALLAAHPNVGTIRDLPMAVQNAIPTLMYADHQYQIAGPSQVVINNQTLRQGQKLGELTLELIAQDGIIMRKGEHRFKLQARSSWVNM